MAHRVTDHRPRKLFLHSLSRSPLTAAVKQDSPRLIHPLAFSAHLLSLMQKLGSPDILANGIVVQDFSIECSDGMSLTGQRWQLQLPRTAAMIPPDDADDPRRVVRILCLHGFLDNCRSFAALAPRLLLQIGQKYNNASSVELMAVDFPGHGKSSHKSLDHPPYSMISDIVFYVAQVVQRLEWNTHTNNHRFILMGHSMGAMASILYSGAFPEHIQQLILLDGFGPDFEHPNRIVSRLRQHVLTRHSGNMSLQQTTTSEEDLQQQPINTSTSRPQQRKTSRRIYKTLEDAIRTRQQTAVKSPGNQWLSYEAAEEMVTWAIMDRNNDQGGWEFRHDSRLYWPALQAHTLEQAFDFWKSLREGHVPTLWLRAEDGWPFSNKWLDRAETFLGSLGTIRTLPGSHHFHADADTVDHVVDTILENLIAFPPTLLR
jgi:pimeloyl-ACP methyl ester carboxylesterase